MDKNNKIRISWKPNVDKVLSHGMTSLTQEKKPQIIVSEKLVFLLFSRRDKSRPISCLFVQRGEQGTDLREEVTLTWSVR